MIKFFRKIRFHLLEKGKSSKYFKYAIGEIFLVVIGILIAVGINSIYNASQNEKKIKAILTQVQQDLKTDIIDAKRIYNVYIGKDSIFQKIMNDSITFEMYKKNPYPLPITGNYVSFSNKKSGYNRLLNNLENLPEKYNCLIPYLSNLHIEIQNEIDDYNTFIKNTVMIDGRKDLMVNPKVADYSMGRYLDKAMAYYFNDPFLKNKSSIYMNDLGNISNAANEYRIESIILYKKIDSLLGKTAIDYDEPLMLSPNKDTINDFLGDYKGASEATLGVKASVSMENKELVLKSSGSPDVKLYWHEGDYFFIKEGNGIFRLYKNKQDQATFDYSGTGGNFRFIKNNKETSN
ncbi:DUF6090 family protein [uncultured Winogradskyella sp.]|uniref:DUF6090 family protein n=1 Tax=uncultured Winogradskyella sp. TaxID=395353 RepID=UPI002638ADDD|nr:DUF6090 family protein [uncultured Winogradskyella sp.]